jgi:hypothetical protein
MTKLTIEFPEALSRKLARAAKQRRVPPVSIVREAVQSALRAPSTPKRKPFAGQPFVSAYDLMKDGLGCWDSGLGDLSTNKKHLEGMGREKRSA